LLLPLLFISFPPMFCCNHSTHGVAIADFAPLQETCAIPLDFAQRSKVREVLPKVRRGLSSYVPCLGYGLVVTFCVWIDQ